MNGRRLERLSGVIGDLALVSGFEFESDSASAWMRLRRAAEECGLVLVGCPVSLRMMTEFLRWRPLTETMILEELFSS